ncbi:outer membrane lipoprotein-sorting protein [candidate division KSB3 bacterium]|uniref:Outer membrane lipoprotein-sorting protein n=1 Tax=candidate division KSB3 bacterium TaxID=2044937 RepID=A0A2G6E4A3_9BACT|nr:MAG: outer membrane lipoprotein-sorting protein [candidate division KSB3 bacterium]PIE29193.1 MAG: outer membrane lipoprotein-sorting protein [candidate division KSB3 bacterium]
MKTFVVGLGFVMTVCMMLSGTLAFAELAEIDARQAVVNVDERDDGVDSTSRLEMILINKKGQERVRKVQTFRKDYDDDPELETRSVMFFMQPADVKDTGFLTWSYEDDDKDDDQWLYLPALKKVRRISSSKKADYFMGTDFSYNDMGDRNVDDYTYKHLGTEVIDGIECYHIESLPKDKDVMKETGYSRGELWIRPDIWVTVKARFYDKKGKFLKELTTGNIEQIDGIWTVGRMHMVNEQKKHQTIFNFTDMTYNTGIDDDVFSQRRLTKGLK